MLEFVLCLKGQMNLNLIFCFRRISTLGHILRLTMFLEFAIAFFNMPRNSKLSIVGHPKSLDEFPNSTFSIFSNFKGRNCKSQTWRVRAQKLISVENKKSKKLNCPFNLKQHEFIVPRVKLSVEIKRKLNGIRS